MTSTSQRKSRRVYDFPLETLLQFAYLRQDEAARALGVAPITLKRICQRRQIRWPYRTVKAQARRAASRSVPTPKLKPLASTAALPSVSASSLPSLPLRPLAPPREGLRESAAAATMVSVLPRLTIPPPSTAVVRAPRTQEPMPSPVLRTPRHMRFRMHFRFGASR
ncbi:hypothetical protein PINS_up003283 [Pythium insidiosum]|nr:hypothetical protein PINS_up003283 [Pythium insidiosum]